VEQQYGFQIANITPIGSGGLLVVFTIKVGWLKVKAYHMGFFYGLVLT